MIIVLNNKCNFSKIEYTNYLEKLNNINININNNDLDVILCPSPIYLAMTNLENIKLGSQNVGRDSFGPHTGEVSSEQLKSVGVEYCLIGHSERRQFNENKEILREKAKMLLKENIIPILCVGETRKEKEEGTFIDIIKNELTYITKDLTEEEIKIIIAYEPVWSIGTGNTPTVEEIEIVFEKIKEILPKNNIIYGGSLNETNINFLRSNKIDGYLLGNLSLYPEKINKFLSTITN